MPSRSSLRAVAEKSGFSLTTVSLALRDVPKIPAETRRIIQEAARELGYQPNQRIAAAMGQIRRPISQRSYDVVAWLYQDRGEESRSPGDHQGIMYEAARARAEKRGWKLEPFRLFDPRMPHRSLARILYNRGIRAAVLPPFNRAVEHLDLDFSRLAAVAIGYSLCDPHLTRVSQTAIDSMEVIFQELARRGYTRPGFAEHRADHLRTHRYPWAAFHFMQTQLPEGQQIPPLDYEDAAEVTEWVLRHRPDVVIAERQAAYGGVRRTGLRVPDEIGFLRTAWTTARPDFTGVDLNYGLMAERAVDLSMQLAQHEEYGIPAIPNVFLVGGTWREGRTLRAPLEEV
jgi:LacI family transcriptional regulator